MRKKKERVERTTGDDILDEIDIDTIYDDIAMKRGMLLKGGIPNYDRVEETIITDFRNGNFGRITIDRI